MITIPTVFILGAGASIPYKFPSGEKLKKIICANLKEFKGENAKTMINVGVARSYDNIKEYRDALCYSGLNSVDLFLESRPEFLEVGKASIAQALIPFEDTRNLYRNVLLKDDAHRISDWYSILYKSMHSTLDEFKNNKISFLTYNYDRSLDYFMYTSLINTHGAINERSIIETLKEIPIIHLHGTLGPLMW